MRYYHREGLFLNLPTYDMSCLERHSHQVDTARGSCAGLETD